MCFMSRNAKNCQFRKNQCLKRKGECTEQTPSNPTLLEVLAHFFIRVVLTYGFIILDILINPKYVLYFSLKLVALNKKINIGRLNYVMWI